MEPANDYIGVSDTDGTRRSVGINRDALLSPMSARARSHSQSLGEHDGFESSQTRKNDEEDVAALLGNQDPPPMWPTWGGLTKTEKTNFFFVVLAVTAWMVLYFPPIFHSSDPSTTVTAEFTLNGFNVSVYESTVPVYPHQRKSNITLNEALNSAVMCAIDFVSGNLRLGASTRTYSAANTRNGDLPKYMSITSVTGTESETTVEAQIQTALTGFHVESTVAAQAVYKATSSDRFSVGFLECAASFSDTNSSQQSRGIHIGHGGIPNTFEGVTRGKVSPLPKKNQVRDEQKCLALLVLVCILWASEAIPLWVTSLLIPLMTVLCKIDMVVTEDGVEVAQGASDAAKAQLAHLADPNVILLMGGFTIAAALKKYGLDRRLALGIFRHAGDNPKVFILVNMWVGFIISMFCNNVAAPVVCFFIVVPILDRIEDQNYCGCVVMAIAFACNVGGMPTPIASPQNSAAKTALESEGGSVSFIDWAGFALPICVPMIFIIWGWMLLYWKPTLKKLPEMSFSTDEPVTWHHFYIAAVTLLTIALWCTEQATENFFGSLGLIALIPIVLFYSVGILSKEDFKQLDWNILMLLGGGSSLGDAVKSSKLLDSIADSITDMFGTSASGFDLWVEFMFFNVVVIILTNFISHTVGAITMMPVIAKVGASMSPARTVPFVIGAVICDSGACALPVSSFPNVIAYGVKNKKGEQYLQVSDYLKAAGVIEVGIIVIMATVGWGLVQSGFV